MDSEQYARSLHDRKRELARLSRSLLTSGSSIALESDKWFVLLLRGTDRGARRLKAEIGRRLVAGPSRLWARWVPSKSPRERICSMLRSEAKRADFDVSQEEFQVFSERMAALLELVLTGAIRMEDIAFEADDADEPGAPSTADLGEVSETRRQSAP